MGAGGSSGAAAGVASGPVGSSNGDHVCNGRVAKPKAGAKGGKKKVFFAAGTK